jgi:hypothetical protein
MLNIEKERPLRLPNQLLNATRYEIWSRGTLIESGNTIADLWVEHLYPQMKTEEFQITVRVKDESANQIYNYIHERFFLDVAYALDDRILVAIIPKSSNIENSSSFNGLINFAPFYTREYCEFSALTPFCCSLYYSVSNELEKVTYSNGMNNTLIEFYL